MGFLFQRLADESSGATPWPPVDPATGFMFGAGGAMTQSGLFVSAQRSMRLSAVWAAYRAIVEGVAGLPCITYRHLERGKARATTMPLYDVLRWQPNSWQTSMEYWEGSAGHAVMRGNAYSLIRSGRRGAVDRLDPLHPDRMFDVTMSKSGVILYRYADPDPAIGDKTYHQDEIFHIRGLGENRLTGMGVIAYAADNLGMHLAREKYQAQIFTKAPMLAGILEAAAGVTVGPDQQKQMVDSFQAAAQEWHGIALTQGGVSWKSIGMKHDELQFIELVDASINDIARWFNVPVHLLRAMKDPNHSNIEMFDQEFVMHTLRPWCIRIEQAIRRDLILAPDTYFSEFLLDALVRANMQTRYAAYQSGIQSGWLTRNEAREKENLNPLPGLDEPMQPLNMGTPGQLRQATKMAQAAAERVVRREVESLRAAATKFAGQPAEWHAHVCQFYAKHERLVQQSLALRDEASRAYVLNQRAAVLDDGLSVCEGWMDTVPSMLAAMALEPDESRPAA